MVSDSDLVGRLREILRDSDLDQATAGSVRRQLEEDLGVDLTDRKAFIREQIDVYLENLGEAGDADDEDGNVKAEDEQPDAAEEEEEQSDGKGSKKRKNSGKVKRRGGFTKLCSLSPQLQSFVGVPTLARTEVVKKLWSYIREKNLQDPKDKRKIICDEALRGLFRVNSINMFQMNKALTKHILPLVDPVDENVCPKAEDEEDADSLSAEEAKSSSKQVEEDEREEDEEGEEETNGRRRKKSRSSKGGKTVKKRGGGFTKVCALSEQLQSFTGVPHMARTEVVKKLWSYIRENNLQNPENKRTIICDDTLRDLFRVDSIDMFQMNKALSKHIWPLSEEEASVCRKMETEEAVNSSSAEETTIAATEIEAEGEEEEDEEEEDQSKEEQGTSKRGGKKKSRTSKEDKGVKKRGGGFAKVQGLSEELQILMGVSQLARTEVVKKLWNYIRENNLQDPNNKRNILCDESLRALFGVDCIDMFQMNKALSKHIIPLNGEEASDSVRQEEGFGKRSTTDEDDQNDEDKQQKGCSGLVTS